MQLSAAVAGALLLWIATSWWFGYLAAQGAHAERDLQELLAPSASGGGQAVPPPSVL